MTHQMMKRDNSTESSAGPKRGPKTILRENTRRSPAGRSALASSVEASRSPVDTGPKGEDTSTPRIRLERLSKELRLSQKALNASLGRYLDFYDRAPVGYCTVSEQGLILQANLTASTLLGMERGRLLKQKLSDFILDEDQDRYYLACRQLSETASPLSCELRIARKKGKAVWVHLTSTLARGDGGVPEFRVVLTDINERKLMDAKLQQSESFNLAILDSVSAEIAVLDREGVILSVNRAWQRFASENGISPGKPVPHTGIGANYLAVCQSSAGSSAMSARDGIQALIEGRLQTFSMEYPCHSAEQQRWFSMVVTPFGDGVVVTHTDITEYKRAEERLRLAASVFSHAREGIMIAAADNTIVDVNETFTKITGYSREEAIGKTSDFLASDQHGPEFYSSLWNEVANKGHWYGEVWNRR